jgi:hypothetical protein
MFIYQKEGITMKKHIFPNVGHLISEVISLADSSFPYFQEVNIVAEYEHLCSILNAIVKNSDYQLCNIKLSDSHVDGYRDEYILSLSDKKIWCQEAKNDKGYLWVDGIITYVHSDCNSAFVIKNNGQPMIEFEFSQEER